MNRVLAPHRIRYVVLGCAVLGTVFLFLLATASANTGAFFAQLTLAGTSTLSNFAKFSESFFVPTM